MMSTSWLLRLIKVIPRLLFLEKGRDKGVIVGKTFVIAQYRVVPCSINGERNWEEEPILFPDSWFLDVKVKGWQGSINVAQELYDQLSPGDLVVVEYTRGSFGFFNIEKVSPV
ncbi:MAG: hypothetical protein V1896_00365 [Candidatus Zambryskibacteria bacterium]